LQLRSKFTDKVTGTGGRLELKRLPGSHITPNTPDLGDLVNGGSAFADQVCFLGTSVTQAVIGARRQLVT